MPREQELEAEVARLQAAIIEHRSQRADDRCWMDDDRLYETLGDGIKCDRRVGDKAAMKHNCERFVDNRCEGGGWPTYVELEEKIQKLEAFKAYVHARLDQLNAPVYSEEACRVGARLTWLAEKLQKLVAAAEPIVAALAEVGETTAWKDGDQTDRVYGWYEIEPLKKALDAWERKDVSPSLPESG